MPRRTKEDDEADLSILVMPYNNRQWYADQLLFPFASLILRDFSKEHIANDVRAKLEVRSS
jgi:hypothetical protein